MYPETEIILLTGYDDFELAQQAIRIGVAEYLLKPVNYKELHIVVEKICSKIRNKIKQQEDYFLLKEQYRMARPQLVRKAISDVVFGHYKEKDEMLQSLKGLKIRLQGALVVYGTLLDYQENVICNFEGGLLDFAVCNICEEIFRKNREDISVFSVTDTMGYCFVIQYPEYQVTDDCMNHCVSACEEAREKLKEIVGKDSSFGISNRARDSWELNLAYKEAVEACEECRFISGEGEVVRYSDINSVKHDKWNMTSGEKKRILSEIVRGNSETAMKFTERIFEKCDDIDVMRYVAMDLLLKCSLYFGMDKVIWSNEKRKENNAVFLESLERIFGSHNRRELLHALRRGLTWESSKHLEVHESRNESLGKEIESYIQENYAKDLSLDDLSDYFKISKAYINRILKRRTGKSFLENLTDIRMIKARMLIQENTYKISEIAEMVGYHDFSYFARVFKKKYGITPNHYRKK